MFEELEQIPWSELMKPPKRPGPWAVAALGVVLVAVVAVLATRSRPVPVAMESATPSTTTSPPVEFDLSVPPDDRLLTEADLRAGDTHELLVLGAAVMEVRSTSTDDNYVEWALAESLTSLGADLWSVRVAFQRLVLDDSGPNRPPVRRVLVPIRVVDGVAGPAGPMSPARSEPVATLDAWTLDRGEVPASVATAAREYLADWAAGPTVVTGGGRVADLWRIDVEVDGVRLAVWIGPNGAVDGLPLPASP